MGTKHVCESLNQFNDYNFFKLFEKEEKKDEKKEKKDTDLKKELQEKEKDGMSIIKKVNDNFKRFQSAAGNKITKYKEFWEENQTMKPNFAEEGNIYKMYDSNYVIGVLSLPDEALEDKTIDSEIETTKEEPVKEAEEFNLNGTEDLSKEENKDQTETTDLEKPVEDTVDGKDLEQGEETAEEKPEETPEFEITDDTSIEAKKSSFVVYDMSSGEREEIFRCLSNNVIKAFNEFYENTFKGSMKSIINQYKEKQETIKKEAEEKERVKQESKKKEKLDKFLGESKNVQNLIKRIKFYLNDDNSTIDIFEETPKSLKTNLDNEIKKESKKLAKGILKNNREIFFIQISYLDEKGDEIDSDEI